uniref:Response regulator n=1 Tax=Geobacter metallireducens TaxID=28232 RepID=A0A831U3X2_GEOME
MDRLRTILLVDDNFMNRRLVAAMLKGEPYRLVEKEGGREGLDYLLANRGTIDLVLLDIGIPDLSGTEICRSLREHEDQGKRLPVIAYTAHAMAEERRSILAAGFDGILTKPITREEFSSVLKRYLGTAATPPKEDTP